jgi:hypothetical protein
MRYDAPWSVVVLPLDRQLSLAKRLLAVECSNYRFGGAADPLNSRDGRTCRRERGETTRSMIPTEGS